MDGRPGREEAHVAAPPARAFAVLTAYNPRSMLLPRRVNGRRGNVMRDLLILGCYRVEPCVGAEAEPEGVWREPAWLVHGMDREEAIIFGRVFRQNTIVVCRNARPELIVTTRRVIRSERAIRAAGACEPERRHDGAARRRQVRREARCRGSSTA